MEPEFSNQNNAEAPAGLDAALETATAAGVQLPQPTVFQQLMDKVDGVFHSHDQPAAIKTHWIQLLRHVICLYFTPRWILIHLLQAESVHLHVQNKGIFQRQLVQEEPPAPSEDESDEEMDLEQEERMPALDEVQARAAEVDVALAEATASRVQLPQPIEFPQLMDNVEDLHGVFLFQDRPVINSYSLQLLRHFIFLHLIPRWLLAHLLQAELVQLLVHNSVAYQCQLIQEDPPVPYEDDNDLYEDESVEEMDQEQDSC